MTTADLGDLEIVFQPSAVYGARDGDCSDCASHNPPTDGLLGRHGVMKNVPMEVARQYRASATTALSGVPRGIVRKSSYATKSKLPSTFAAGVFSTRCFPPPSRPTPTPTAGFNSNSNDSTHIRVFHPQCQILSAPSPRQIRASAPSPRKSRASSHTYKRSSRN